MTERKKDKPEIGVLAAFLGSEPPSYIRDVGQLLEEMGFCTLWVPEHALFFPKYAADYPFSSDGKLRGVFKGLLGPFSVLNYLAASTTRMRLATGICIVPQHNPVYLAKHVADVDLLSEGRFDFGVGVGWQKEEYEALGIPFSERGKRMDESLEAMKALWTEDVSNHSGEFYGFKDTWAHPKPAQGPFPPIHIGGDSPAALRRVATHGDGWFGYNLTPASCRTHMDRLKEKLDQHGVAMADREIILAPAVECNDEEVQAFKSMGADQIVMHMEGADLDSIRAWAERTLALFD